MKNLFKVIFVFSAFVVFATITSCSNELHEVSSFNNETIEFSKLLNSIDSLNRKYVPQQDTRGFWHKWGRRALAGTVDGCVGCVSGAATGGFGGLVFGGIASGLYDDYMDNIERRMSRSSTMKETTILPVQKQHVIFQSDNGEPADFIDSIGYYHNLILDELKASGISYVHNDTDVDYEGIYKAVTTICKKYGICYNEDNHDKKLAIFAVTDNFIKIMAKDSIPDLDTCFNVIENKKISSLGISSEKMKNLHQVCNKIVNSVVSTSSENAISYGNEINKIVDNSSVSLPIKKEIKITNNIAVNSYLYWNDK